MGILESFRKLAIVLLLIGVASINLEARIINGIALLVNGEPVTLYEIEKVKQTFQVEKEKAIDLLIDRKIEQSAIKEFGIKVGQSEVEDYMFRNAMQAKMNVFEYEQALQSKGIDILGYKEDLKDKIKKDKLLQYVIESSYKEPSDTELNEYYQLNSKLFNLPRKIQVRKYISQNPNLLEKYIQAPLMMVEGISSQEEILEQENINPELWAMLSSVQNKSFSQIIQGDGGYVSFFVVEKQDIQTVSFDQAKNLVRAKYLKEQENMALEDFYKKRRASADVVVIESNKGM